MTDFESSLRAFEEDRQQVKQSKIKQRIDNIAPYEQENDDENQAEPMDHDENEDDIELDEIELQAYMNLQKAHAKIDALENPKPKNDRAHTILRTNKSIYNNKQILSKLQDIQISDSQPFIESLRLDATQKLVVGNVEDDLDREFKFYEQALVSAQEGFHKLRALGIEPERPDDYFAEMVKTDEHMERVKQKLLIGKQIAEKKEQSKKRRELKKMGKQIQTEKLKKKIEEKKANMKVLDYWRKNYSGKGQEFDMKAFEENVKNSAQETRGKRKAKDDANVRKTKEAAGKIQKQRPGKNMRNKLQKRRK